MFVNRLSEFEDNPAIDKTAIAIARSKSAVDRWARYLLAALAIEEDLTIDECVAAADLALAESPPPPNDHIRFLNRT